MTFPVRFSYAVVAVALLLSCAAGAQCYRIHVTCPAVISLPAGAIAAPKVYVRGADEQWRPMVVEVEDGRLVLALDPAKLGGGRAKILINPPPDLDIHDAHAPRLIALEVDGKALPTDAAADLEPSAGWPKRLILKAEDRENRMDAGGVRITLDGKGLAAPLEVSTPAERTLVVQATLPKPDYGDHMIRYSITDVSPQSNKLSGEITFGRYDMTNFVLKAHGTKLVADSYFQTYPSLDCLQDGDVKLPGNTLPNAISWASAETKAPHWVEVQFAQPRTVKEVTIYWANYAHELHTSKRIEVHIPEGEGWKAVYASPPEGEQEATCTTAEFAPVEVTRFRVYQPASAGSPSRPDLMWLAEVEAR